MLYSCCEHSTANLLPSAFAKTPQLLCLTHLVLGLELLLFFKSKFGISMHRWGIRNCGRPQQGTWRTSTKKFSGRKRKGTRTRFVLYLMKTRGGSRFANRAMSRNIKLRGFIAIITIRSRQTTELTTDAALQIVGCANARMTLWEIIFRTCLQLFASACILASKFCGLLPIARSSEEESPR